MGKDSNDGTKEYPLATLAGANNLLSRLKLDANVEVRVLADKGGYRDHATVWSYCDPKHTTTITGYPEGRHAVFWASDENPPRESFLKVTSESGASSNLHIRYIELRNYVTRAIEIMGDRESRENGWNGNNIIDNCIFLNIGNERMPERKLAYSVIALVNSRNNKISNCLFADIANATDKRYPQNSSLIEGSVNLKYEKDELPIKGIYLAHYATGNIIVKNTFNNIKGDCIRIRDYSNENVIEGNIFNKSGWNAVCTMWYCDRRNTICTKRKAECPSYENILRNNVVNGNWMCETPTLFLDLYRESKERCRLINPAYKKRLYLFDNTLNLCGPENELSGDRIE